MRSFLLAALVAAPLAASAAERATETRKVAGFTSLAVAAGLEVELVAGPPSVTLSGPAAEVSAVQVSVDDGVLRVRRQSPSKQGEPVSVRISTAPLARIEAAGGVRLRFDGATVQPRLSLSLAGGVDVAATGLRLERLELDAAGGVAGSLSGQSNSGRVALSAGVDLDARALRFSTLALEASAGCDVDVSVADAISGSASTGTSVRIAGHPKGALGTSLGADVQLVD